MTSATLARSYLIKAEKRLKVLLLLFEERDYSDVVRESQEIVELSLKGMLRYVGIEPPRFHDVGSLLLEHRDRFRGVSDKDLDRLVKISKRLRKERELSFYGDIDFIPTEEYTIEDGREAMEGANFVVEIAKTVIRKGQKNG